LISFQYLSQQGLELGLQGIGAEAIRTAFEKEEYGYRVAKCKGFSDDPEVMAYRVRFAKEGLTGIQQRLEEQIFSDEVWEFGGAFTQ
jgi:hypothetical protein